MNELILKDEDLFEEEHWPVEVVFGFYEGEGPADMGFPSIAKGFGAGIGYDYNDKGCTFWTELDEYDQTHEEKFDVICHVVKDKCVLTFHEFYEYMGIACRRYAKRFPETATALQEALDGYKTIFLQE